MSGYIWTTTGEVIPLNFAMLMSRSPSPPTGFLPLSVNYISQSLATGAHHGKLHQLGVGFGVDDDDNYDYHSSNLDPDDYLCNASFPCRRISTFPLAAPNHFHFPKASSLKSRSVSESNYLNNQRLSVLNMNDLILELSHIACVIQHQPTQLVDSRVLFPSAPERKGSSLSSDDDESDDDTPSDSPPVNCIDEPMESFTIRPNLFDFGQDKVDLGLLKVAGQYSSPMKYPSEAVDRIKNDVTPRFLSPTRYRPSYRPCRKRVCFADERGRCIATVRIMKEASDVPPKLDRAIIRALIGDDDNEVIPATWQMNFKQPCSDYMKFRSHLAGQNVALENLVVKNHTHRLVGTIKVRNMCFHKEVIVRLTENQWDSYIDSPAQFSGTVPGDPYDTFAFDFEIPTDDDLHPRLEFAICFKAIGSDDPSIIFEPQEFWDNNDSVNYTLLSGKVKQMWDLNINRANENIQGNQNADSPTLDQHGRVCKNSTYAFTLDCGNWSNFASWRDLTVEGPYW